MQRLVSIALVALTLATWGHGQAAAGVDQTLGGGGDIRNGAVVELASGTSIGPSHHVFADNPGTRPIAVEFMAETHAGIDIVPEDDRLTIEPGASVHNPFSIEIDPALAPGDYPVAVYLVLADVRSAEGVVTNVPAVGTAFTVRVVGAKAQVDVEARSLESGEPVDGTLVLAALMNAERPFEVERAEGSRLSATVAPGRYVGSFLLDGREIAAGEVTVAEGETATIDLAVNTVSFALVNAEPVHEDGRVVVANLTAAVNNHVRTIDGGVTIQARVYHDDVHTDTIVIEDGGELPIGLTEATLVYRPPSGFQPGTYRFDYELVTSDFTITAADAPSFSVAPPSSFSAGRYLAIGGAAAAIAAAAAVGIWLSRHRSARSHARA